MINIEEYWFEISTKPDVEMGIEGYEAAEKILDWLEKENYYGNA